MTVSTKLTSSEKIKKEIAVNLPTEFGDFLLIAYTENNTDNTHLVLKKGTWNDDEDVIIRVHSSCITGDVLHSLRCDCGDQLKSAMKIISNEDKGLILYMNQEGRGIGLVNKLKAYKLQEEGMDTADANIALGFKMDQRNYEVAAEILKDQNVKRIRLLTNNPNKQIALDAYGLEIIEKLPIEIFPNTHNYNYLKTKKEKFGHLLKMVS